MDGGNAFTFRPGDVQDFRDKILWLAQMSGDRFAEVSTNARRYVLRNFDYVPIAQKFTDVLQRAVLAYRRNAGA
jgi:hypothetical protein